MEKEKFSLYDIEQFLRDAGAERVNEKAVQSFADELKGMVDDLVQEAEVYAKYAGRRRLVTKSDISMATMCKSRHVYVRRIKRRPAARRARQNPVLTKPVLNVVAMRAAGVMLHQK